MKTSLSSRNRRYLRFLATCLSGVAMSCSSAVCAERKPNIIFILTDDLGYGDIGVFYQNQRRALNDRSQPSFTTPHLDEMAARGIQLRDHYCSAPVCAPSRASLLLGVSQGHANVRDNQFDKALENNHTIATVLKGAGYATAAFGKWGLQGGPKEKSPAAANAGPAEWSAFPTKRGFDFYFGYVRHGDGHAHYPKEDGKQVWENEKEVSADLAGCYTTDLFTARAKKWIIDHCTIAPQQPFMAYLAFDTPHAKIQYPPRPYPDGAGRTGGLQWLGKPGQMTNAADGTPDGWCHPDYANATWDDDHDASTPEKPWPDVYRRYATSVRRIDDCVGDLLQLLKDLKIEDNTLVVFTSDNGISDESYLKESFSPQFFRSFGQFDGIKRDCLEGGIRVGALACWPGFIPAGTINREPSIQYDWMATFAELAGVPAPARTDGESLVPTLRGKEQKRVTPIYIEYFMNGKTPDYPEFSADHRKRTRGQMQAIRIGNMMGLRYGITNANEPFEIYNVAHDPQQAKNLAGETPEYASIQRAMQDAVKRIRRPNNSAGRPYDGEAQPSVNPDRTEPGVVWRSFSQAAPWVPRLDGMKPVSSGTNPRPDPAIGANVVSLFFTGYIEVPEDGEYAFHLTSDSGSLLRLQEATVIDADFGHVPGTEVIGAVVLKAGKHPFRLYVSRRHDAELMFSLQWSRPGQPNQDIPATAFSHDVP